MKVVLKTNEYGTKDIHLIEENKTLSIVFAGTGDLHWIIKNNKTDNDEEYSYDNFEITKENYQVYSLFEKLLYDIKNINIFDKECEFPPYVETDEEKEYYLEEQELDKKRYRMFNMAHYNDLYNDDEKIITWVSDETGFEVANKVLIHKLENRFLIEFKTQPYIEGYEREDNLLGIMGIRFRNSGSRYEPFNIVFMRMFREMQNIDDINDYGHQIHMEEYLYEKNKIKKLSLSSNNG